MSISGHFWTTQKKQSRSIRSRKISCNWEKNFLSIISEAKIFRANQKKILILLKFLVSRCQHYVYSTSKHEDLYIFSSLFYFSFVINNVQPICLDCLNNYIYTFHFIIAEVTRYFECVGVLEILQLKFLERWVYPFGNTLLNTGSTHHCSIENNIFWRLLEKQKAFQLPSFFFFPPLLFRSNG